jgi:alkylation response protein AidB-like acyl-CoA dehydrogenase
MARLTFEKVAAQKLDTIGPVWAAVQSALDMGLVALAGEQAGGARRVLEMTVDYAKSRIQFGRPIGSFQAIKHMLADMYVAATLARSNAYYGAWALSTGAAELGVAAATARVSATKAFQLCGKNNIQVHGGMGFTWAFDCHLFYRRANLLALTLGGQSEWEDKLVERLRRRNAA